MGDKQQTKKGYQAEPGMKQDLRQPDLRQPYLGPDQQKQNTMLVYNRSFIPVWAKNGKLE